MPLYETEAENTNQQAFYNWGLILSIGVIFVNGYKAFTAKEARIQQLYGLLAVLELIKLGITIAYPNPNTAQKNERAIINILQGVFAFKFGLLEERSDSRFSNFFQALAIMLTTMSMVYNLLALLAPNDNELQSITKTTEGAGKVLSMVGVL